MKSYLLAPAALALFSTVFVAASGCSAPAEEDLATAYGAATPANPSGDYGLAETCSRLFKRHEAVHDIDLDEGVIRWGCGDVPGVTAPDFGQEYCEYQGIQGGKVVAKAADIVPTGGKVSCVFTSVFKDVTGIDAKLQAEMGKPENLGAAAATFNIIRMQGRFNSRGAATQLLKDCSRDPGAATLLTRQKTAACFLEVAKGGPNSAALQPICKGNLNDAANWAQAVALGVAVKEPRTPGYETQQDIASCMQVRTAGVPWRNSDPMICSRTERSANECSCKFQEVPSTLNGFPFTGWVDDHIPSGCRLAKVDNADYPFIAICEASAQEVADLPLNPAYSRSIQTFCKERFGADLVMKLPLRDLQVTDTCQTSGSFCSEYMSTEEPTAPTAPTEPTEPTPPTTPRGEGAPNPPVDPGGSTH